MNCFVVMLHIDDMSRVLRYWFPQPYKFYELYIFTKRFATFKGILGVFESIN